MSLDVGSMKDLLQDEGLAGASLIVERIDPGATQTLVSVVPDAPISPASMIKVPIAAALTAAWAAGSLRPDQAVSIAAANLTANDGPSPFVPGYRARLDELGGLMLTRSDNVATNTLIDVLGREAISAFCRGAGLTGTVVRRKLSGSLPLIDDPGAQGRNAHPAADSARLFGAIALGSVAGSEWLLDTLSRQEWNGKLSLGLEPGDGFAHKTGDTDEVSHDGGILTTKEAARYVVVLYAPVASPDGDDPRFARVMRALRASL